MARGRRRHRCIATCSRNVSPISSSPPNDDEEEDEGDADFCGDADAVWPLFLSLLDAEDDEDVDDDKEEEEEEGVPDVPAISLT
jgi:hypothetical protein